MYNVFYILLLKQDITKKKRVWKVLELNASNNSKEYKMEVIWDIAVYANKSESGYLLGLYYLVAWKNYLKTNNT